MSDLSVEDTFDALRRRSDHSNNPHLKKSAILVDAVTQTLQEKNAKPTAVTYFGALLLLMDQNRAADAETHGALLYLLSLVLPHLPRGVLLHKYSEFTQILITVCTDPRQFLENSITCKWFLRTTEHLLLALNDGGVKPKLWKQRQSQQLLQVLLVYSMDSRRKLRRNAQLVLRNVFRSFRTALQQKSNHSSRESRRPGEDGQEEWSGIPGKLAELVSGFLKHQVSRSSVSEDDTVVFLCGFLQLTAEYLSDTALMACLLPIIQLAVQPGAKPGLRSQTLRTIASIFHTQKPRLQSEAQEREDAEDGREEEGETDTSIFPGSTAGDLELEQDLERWPLEDPTVYRTGIRFRPGFLEGLLTCVLEFRDIRPTDVSSSTAFLHCIRIGIQTLRRQNADKASELGYQFLPLLAPFLLQSQRTELRRLTFQSLCAVIDAILILPSSGSDVADGDGDGEGRDPLSRIRNGRRTPPQSTLSAFLENLLDPRWKPLWAQAFRLVGHSFSGCVGVPSGVDEEWTARLLRKLDFIRSSPDVNHLTELDAAIGAGIQNLGYVRVLEVLPLQLPGSLGSDADTSSTRSSSSAASSAGTAAAATGNRTGHGTVDPIFRPESSGEESLVEQLQTSRDWLLPLLKQEARGVSLAWFTEHILPAVERLSALQEELREHSQTEFPVQEKALRALEQRLLELFPSFCVSPLDTADILPRRAEYIAQFLKPDKYRGTILKGLIVLVRSNQQTLEEILRRQRQLTAAAPMMDGNTDGESDDDERTGAEEDDEEDEDEEEEEDLAEDSESDSAFLSRSSIRRRRRREYRERRKSSSEQRDQKDEAVFGARSNRERRQRKSITALLHRAALQNAVADHFAAEQRRQQLRRRQHQRRKSFSSSSSAASSLPLPPPPGGLQLPPAIQRLQQSTQGALAALQTVSPNFLRIFLRLLPGSPAGTAERDLLKQNITVWTTVSPLEFRRTQLRIALEGFLKSVAEARQDDDDGDDAERAAAEERMRSLADILQSIIPGLPGRRGSFLQLQEKEQEGEAAAAELELEEVEFIFRAVPPLLRDDSKPLLQKKAYQLLGVLLDWHPRFLEQRWRELGKLLAETAECLAVSSLRSRLRVLRLLMRRLPPPDRSSEFSDLLPVLVGEAVLAGKDVSSRKTREAGWDILTSLGDRICELHDTERKSMDGMDDADDADEERERMTPPLLSELMVMIMGGIAGATPQLQSASLLAMSRLIFGFRDRLRGETLLPLLETVALLIRRPQQKSREVVKAALSFLKVTGIALDPLDLEKSLGVLLPALCDWAGEPKDRFRMKVRGIFELLLRKLPTPEVLLEKVPEDLRPLLLHLRKQLERAKRKRQEEWMERQQQQQQQRRGRRGASSSASSSVSSRHRDFDDLLDEAARMEDDDGAGDGGTSGGKFDYSAANSSRRALRRKQLAEREAWDAEDVLQIQDEDVDFLDEDALNKVTLLAGQAAAMQPFLGGDGDGDGGMGGTEERKRKSKQFFAEDSQGKILVGEDSLLSRREKQERMTMMRMQDDSESEDDGDGTGRREGGRRQFSSSSSSSPSVSGGKRRRRDTEMTEADAAEEEEEEKDGRQTKRLRRQQQRRTAPGDLSGEYFRSTKASGDMQKGRLQPFAYLKADPSDMNRRNRNKTKDRFSELFAPRTSGKGQPVKGQKMKKTQRLARRRKRYEENVRKMKQQQKQ